MNIAFTIGHSSHPIKEFIKLLKLHSITAIGDVRSQPYSRLYPQFNKGTLEEELRQNKITYIFLGKELGARTDDPNCYANGKVQYSRLANTTFFREGLHLVSSKLASFRIALLCAEKDPLTCHRAVLVARHLQATGIQVEHILENGELESQTAVERRLLRQLKITEPDLFRTHEELVAEAFEIQSQKIAYQLPADLDELH